MFMYTSIVALGLMALLPLLCMANTPSAKNPAQGSLQASAVAAQNWLGIVDKGSYAQSWDQGSGLMKMAIPKDDWIKLMESTRRPLGSVVSRQVLDQRVAQNPHGLPKGEYMVMYYKTDFSAKKGAKELVTLFSEDGDWHVMTYQVDTGVK